MKLLQTTYSDQGYPDHNNELHHFMGEGIETTVGTVFLKKGSRIPEKGHSRHPFNEVSIIVEGHIEMVDEGNKVIGHLKKGSIVCITAGEPQAGNVLEDTRLIYVLNQLR
ncbi:MAG: hypothetical protein AB3N16_06180 [Flavobacteriaceae bacterium]